MSNIFFEQFLMISELSTIIFLLILGGLFVIIHYLYKKKHLDFSIVVLIGTFFGLLLGLLIQFVAGFPEKPLDIPFIVETTTWYGLIGNGFIDLIRMLVVPLVLVSIVNVIISMEQGKSMGQLVRRTLLITMFMAAVSAIIGIVTGLVLKVGGNPSTITDTAEAKEIVSVAKTLRGLIPANIVTAMTESNIIGLVIFAAFFGVALWWVNHESEEAAKPLYKGVQAFHKTMVNMALLILDYMPFGVIPLLANTIAQRGLSSIVEVGRFIIAIYIACAIQFIIQLGALGLFGLNPLTYLKKSMATMLLAFTSRSSVGCLPMTIETLTKRLGVNQGTASFVAGFGTTAGMQGCAGIFPALLIIYVSNTTGSPIDITLLVMTVVVVTIGSLGIAGIPGTATMAASVGLSGVGMASAFPMISPILAIDPIVDMPRTLLNVTGSLTNALMVDKSLGNLDLEKYNDMELNKLK